MMRGDSVYLIHADHLSTPRAVTDIMGTVVWRWDIGMDKGLSNVFGENEPTTDSSAEPIEFNLRFPGQYRDATGIVNYNYFRDYEPGTGRYVESDPVGLLGGTSTYGYALSNPLKWSDSKGLVAGVDDAVIVVVGGAIIAGCIISGGCESAGRALEDAYNSICLSQSDACHERFDEEAGRCERWRGRGPSNDPNRWQFACKSRAANRRNLCVGNNGQPSADEPPEWSLDDLP